jgi:putative glutamine amidotransferase
MASSSEGELFAGTARGKMKILISVSDKERTQGTRSPYFKALVEAGAQPEELELVTAADGSCPLQETFAGVLFTGGEDVDPEFYDEPQKHENVRPNRKRDEFEMELLGRALEGRRPVLGICRGAQMVNVKFGGSLYQDLKSDFVPSEHLGIEHRQTGSRALATHSVTVTEPDSRLAKIFTGRCRVNSLHHQAIRRVGHGLKVTAYSEDGLPEAIETADDYPFLMAVQWHPEEMTNREEQLKIFQTFLEKCRQATKSG